MAVDFREIKLNDSGIFLCESTASRNLKAASLRTILPSHSITAISPMFINMYTKHTFIPTLFGFCDSTNRAI